MIDYQYKYIKYKSKYQRLKHNFMHGGNSDDIKVVKYGEVSDNIPHVGKFMVTDKIIAGESWNIELDMPKGLYDLIIVHENNKNKINKDYLFDKIFDVIGDVGVDGGTFGFYDSGIIYKIIPKKDNLIGGPTIPSFNMPDGKNDSLVKSNMITDSEAKKKYKNLTFGVMSYTDTGDGFFKCITNKADGIAILLGDTY